MTHFDFRKNGRRSKVLTSTNVTENDPEPVPFSVGIKSEVGTPLVSAEDAAKFGRRVAGRDDGVRDGSDVGVCGLVQAARRQHSRVYAVAVRVGSDC